MDPLLSVIIVTCNSGRYIGGCLESLHNQDYRPIEIIVVDNASSDNTLKLVGPARTLGREQISLRVVRNGKNLGFSVAQNQGIRASHGQWVLALNPDTTLERDFLSRLVAAAETDDSIGTLCGRLAAMGSNGSGSGLLDSTGIYFTPTLRHFDRGCRQKDNGDFTEREYVFGSTAAAALYKRQMIEDISPDGEFFDEDFFFYREDADVAWRAQLLGWKCLYVPEARGYHARTAQPGNRSKLPAAINMHSVKNRFLMRIKNITPSLYLRHFLAITMRDLCVVGYVVLVEHSSLPAFGLLRDAWKRAFAKRRWIQTRKRTSGREVARWFRYHPATQPVPQAVSLPAGAAGSGTEVLPAGETLRGMATH